MAEANRREWVEFDGICTVRFLMGGAANVEDHLLNAPSGAYRVVLDTPVKGSFTKGVGTFYSDTVCDGKAVRIRSVWSQITRT